MNQQKKEVSEVDKKNLVKLRMHVTDFMKESAKNYDKEGLKLLDIAPQVHEGASPYFTKVTVETLDIDPESKATYIADLCKTNDSSIPSNSFDIVVCTEVLEHTLQPFDAVTEIKRILKKEGIVLISAPFNFRIHGPLPDCWRFSIHGLKALFKEFEIMKIDALEDEERFLAPIHYTLVARKK